MIRGNAQEGAVQDTHEIKRFLRISMLSIMAVCVAVFLFLGLYTIRQNERTIDKVGSLYMASMNERISKHFSTMIDLRLTQLDTLTESVPGDSREDSWEMREWLEYNGKLRGFEALAYFFKDGSFEMIYGEPARSINADRFFQSMQNGERKVSVGVGIQGEKSAFLGIPFAVSLQGGRKSIAIVGRMPIEYIGETLSLGEENALLYSFVIRQDGSFVVRSAGASRDNYFERVRALYEKAGGKRDVEQYIAALQEAMAAKTDYSTMIEVGGERRQVYCSSLPSSDWYLLTILPYGALNETIEARGRMAFLTSMASCLVILLVLLLVFMKYSRMSHKQLLELAEAKRTAESASKAKSEFFSNMSHDIRTPMNAVVGMTMIALANVSDPGRVEDCLKKISLSSRHLLGLINDVLDMSKIESGKMTLSPDRVSLRETMESIVSIAQPQIKEKQQRFDIFIYDITTEHVLCDSVRLNQVLLNLLSNAIKFTPAGGSVEVSLREQASPRGNNFVRILLRVKDTGIGMSEEFQKKIFESFTREDSKRVHKTEGTGLGMAITKYIVDAMGGEIEVKSTQGVGTEFNITLDLERTEEAEEDMVLPDFTMLVVDDDQQLCESTAASLQSIGVRADWALDGESAVRMVRQHHEGHSDYRVILLDMRLPGMDGIKTARELRKQLGGSVPILLISAYDWSEIEDEARSAGVTGFLSKPLFKSTLYYGLKPYVCGGQSEPGGESELKKNAVDLSGRRVLLAEDNDLNWEIASELLQGAGLELERAENGEICANLFRASPVGYYDAILMDIRMPVKDGYEATDLIRGMDRPDRTVPIIAMTADAFSEDVQKCMEHGINAHVAKPIDIKEVFRILNKFLGSAG